MVRVFSDRYVLAEHQSFSKVIPLCTHALCIEAGHQKLFYSGDFRAHGRKGALCEALTDNPPTSITTLLMEGSSIGRIPDYGHYPTEDDIEQQLAKQFTAADGLGLVHTSSQNIDRVVSILRAAQRTGRTLIIDLYTAAILAATENPKIPQSHWEQVRLYVPQSQRVQIKRKGWFAQLQQHASNRIYREDLVDMAATAVLIFRPLQMRDLTQADCLQGAVYIFS